MNRRAFLGTLGLLAPPCLVEAQQAGKVPRIVVFGVTAANPALSAAFTRGLADAGYVDGRSVVVDYRDTDGKPERLHTAAADLVRAEVDLVFARGAGALTAAKRAMRRIPIVAVDLESDPVAMGFVRTLAQPGGNITGVFLDLPELSGKQLQLLKEIIRSVPRVAVLGDPVLNAPQFRATEVAARALAIQVQLLEVVGSGDFPRALEGATRGRSSAVLLLSSPLVLNRRVEIAALAVERRLPAISMFAEFAEAGGLVAYGPSLREAFARAGVYAGRILHGAKPEDLPVERPTKFELVVNLRTAKTLGLTIPPSLLQRADHVIE